MDREPTTCELCGGAPVLTPLIRGYYQSVYCVTCRGCGACSPFRDNVPTAIAVWDDRQARIDACRGCGVAECEDRDAPTATGGAVEPPPAQPE